MVGALFPGQGSQSVGMGRFLFDEFATTRQLFEEASDVLKVDFKKLCFEGPDSALQLTENTQPALLLVSTATFRVVSQLMPLKVKAAAGHSVGEYAALVAAGVLQFSDALRAVRRRGEAMQRAVPVGQGAMAAVMGPTDDQVRSICKAVEADSGEKPLEAANFNCPGQVVISGSAKAIEWLKANNSSEWLAAKVGPGVGRVKLIPLSVSAPFHCSLMKPAEEEMRKVLTALSFDSPKFSVFQNLTAKSESSPDQIRQNLIGQISGTVLWTQCQQELVKLGLTEFVEFGAGKVLSGLAKKISGETVKVWNLNSLEDIRALEVCIGESECQNP